MIGWLGRAPQRITRTGTVFENIMTTTPKPDQLLLRFRPTDTQNGISRSTVKKLAEYPRSPSGLKEIYCTCPRVVWSGEFAWTAHICEPPLCGLPA